MKVVSDEVARVAAILGADYLRSLSLSEANVDTHYTDQVAPLIIYNGRSSIATEYEGAEIIDAFECEIYFLVRKTTPTMNATDVDDLLQITKLLANKFYFNVNTVRDIDSYTLLSVGILDDFMVGHMMTVTLTFENEGC